MAKKQEFTENPYTNARITYKSNSAKERGNTKMWQLTTSLALFITCIMAGGYIYERTQSKFIPYVVEVNELGQHLTSKIAEKAAPVDARIIKATLAQFINDLRIVTPDTTLQKTAIQNVYAHLATDGPAIQKTTQFYANEKTNPFKIAEKSLVTVNILSVLPQTEKSWQVTWLEKEYDRKGAELGITRRTSILQIAIKEPTETTTEEEIRQNPLGIFIYNYDLSEELQ
ncbi:VirB8/TrbF family protein [Pasteurella multocida]|uniref:VirB8/TrbF family protein n=1 Tax=Pasteurella multocida TaxID=747 RepID=UPI0013F4357F|nr:VirB8/TrbF family protein [Pasteurella multocida]